MSVILFVELLDLVKRHSNNDKPTREQVYAALEILSGDFRQYSLLRLGINIELAKLIGKEQACALARTIMMCAVFGDDLNDNGFDEDAYADE